MFSKVLIADDLGSINRGVETILATLGINNVDQVQYCDDAYLKVKSAIQNSAPYDLVITDLSFKIDHRDQKLGSGETLAKQLKSEYPDLRVIVYSVEDSLQRVRNLIQNIEVNAYVCKGRHGLMELAAAILLVHDNKIYVSPQVEEALKPRSNLEITDYDIVLLEQLSKGLSQDEISEYLKTNDIKPASLSSVEKHINKLKKNELCIFKSLKFES